MKEGNFNIAKNTVIIAVTILTMIIHDNVDEDEDDIMKTAVVIMTMIKVNAVLPHWCMSTDMSAAQFNDPSHILSHLVAIL